MDSYLAVGTSASCGREAGRSRKINTQKAEGRASERVSGRSKSVLARNSRRRFVNSAKLFLPARVTVRGAIPTAENRRLSPAEDDAARRAPLQLKDIT